MPWPCVVPVGLRLRLIRKEIRGTRARLGRCNSVRVGRIRLPTLGLVLGRKFTDMMTLAGAAENQYAGGQRETGSAKKNSHNASDSKRRALEGARRKAGEERRQDAAVNCRAPGGAPYQGRALSLPRAFSRRFVNRRSLFLGMKLKGLSVALL